MKEPKLVIMAAGMGSRYGGLKQMDPMDERGHLIIDYSIYDAVQAGFRDVIFVIREENHAVFEERIGSRLRPYVRVQYAFQSLEDLPEGYAVPEGRQKPWGTGHAVLSCRELLEDAPFAVINADDYYGRTAFRKIYGWLTTHADDAVCHWCMVGYELRNTVTENGSVARGICRTGDNGLLTEITERTRIEIRPEGIAWTEDDGQTWHGLPEDTPVSMNLWGFSAGVIRELAGRFPAFLAAGLRDNPLKCEFFLPFVVEEVLKEGKADVEVLRTADVWHGVTYREDREKVVEALRRMVGEGLYPPGLLEG